MTSSTGFYQEKQLIKSEVKETSEKDQDTFHSIALAIFSERF